MRRDPEPDKIEPLQGLIYASEQLVGGQGVNSPAPLAGEGGVRGEPRGQEDHHVAGKDQKRAERARSLRRGLTAVELTLWTRIRGRRLGGFKFVRQEPIDRYYVDFVCRERRLITELDGGQHAESTDDRRRDRTLCALGYRVLRIWNNDIIENLDGVLQRLLSELKNRPSPRPSLRERGEGDNWYRSSRLSPEDASGTPC